MKNSKVSRQVGFSLLELLAILLLISLLANLSQGYIVQYRYSRMLQNAGFKLMSFLINVQSQASWHNQARKITVSQYEDHWLVAAVTDSNIVSGETEANKLPFTQQLLLDKAWLDLVSENPQSPIIFYGRRNMASPGHIRLLNSTGEVRIIISARGRLRLCGLSSDHVSAVAGLPLCL